MREQALLQKLHADLGRLCVNYVLLKFSALPMASDWSLDEILPCDSRAYAREMRARFITRNPHLVAELWGRGSDGVCRCVEPHGPAVIPVPGSNVSPAQVPIGLYVGDGLRVWMVQSLKAAGVPSVWVNLPCLVCYRDLAMPQPGKQHQVNPGDVLVGFAAASMLFIGSRKRAEALFEEAGTLNKKIVADLRVVRRKSTNER